jgi:hypothetical protein
MTDEMNSTAVEKEGVYVVKMDGEKELFDIHKLRGSLRRAKASEETIEMIVEKIEQELFEGMSTGEIYRHAYEMLEKAEKHIAARYSLRRALADLGPTGFPFEFFIGELFRAKGYTVRTGEMVQGRCVEHEVDMIAENETEMITMEIKFHNSVKIKSDMKVALYVKARFDDIMSGQGTSDKKREGWLLTNTKFTRNVLRYAECSGLKIVSWSYPENASLQTMIEETGLHPLTCLSTLPKREMTLLLNEGVVLCRDIKTSRHLLEKYGLSSEVIDRIQHEATSICNDESILADEFDVNTV